MPDGAAPARRHGAGLPGWPGGLRRELAAAYLGISPTTLDQAVAAGKLPRPVPLIGTVKVWRLADLDAYLAGLDNAPQGTTGEGWTGA